MGKCDVCNADMNNGEGYILTTRQVVASEDYWDGTLAMAASMVKSLSGDTGDVFLQMGVQQTCAQSTGWMVCESCISRFPKVDRNTARGYAMEFWSRGAQGSYKPPGGGAIPPSEAMNIARRVWQRKIGGAAVKDSPGPASATAHSKEGISVFSSAPSLPQPSKFMIRLEKIKDIQIEIQKARDILTKSFGGCFSVILGFGAAFFALIISLLFFHQLAYEILRVKQGGTGEQILMTLPFIVTCAAFFFIISWQKKSTQRKLGKLEEELSACIESFAADYPEVVKNIFTEKSSMQSIDIVRKGMNLLARQEQKEHASTPLLECPNCMSLFDEEKLLQDGSSLFCPACFSEYHVNNIQRMEGAEIKVDPEYTELIRRGDVYKSKGEYDHAIEEYSKAIRCDPNNSGLFNNRGNAYQDKGEYGRAIEDFSKAILLNPSDSDFYFNRGNAHDRKGEPERAIEDYNKAIQINPVHPFAYVSRGAVFYATQNYEEAKKDYTKAIEINPKNVKALNNLGNIYLQKEQYDRAIDKYTRAIEIDPEYTPAYNNRGTAYAQKKEWDKFRYDMEKVVELDPQSAMGQNAQHNLRALKSK